MTKSIAGYQNSIFRKIIIFIVRNINALWKAQLENHPGKIILSVLTGWCWGQKQVPQTQEQLALLRPQRDSGQFL